MFKIAKLKSIKGHTLLRRYGSRWLLATLLYVLLVWIMVPGMRIRGKIYQTGDIPKDDVRAPFDFLIPDEQATEEMRTQAASAVQAIYVLDEDILNKVNAKIALLFESAKKSAKRKDAFPSLSSFALRILRSEARAAEIKEGVNKVTTFILQQGFLGADTSVPETGSIIIKQASIEGEHERELIQIVRADSLEELTEKRAREIFPEDRLARRVIWEITESVLLPNLKLDKQVTNARRLEAWGKAPLQYTRVKQGERLLAGGVRVTKDDLVKLEVLRMASAPRKALSTLAGIALLALIFFFVVGIYLHRYQPAVLSDLRILLLLGLIVIGVIFVTRFIVSYGWSGYLIPAAIAPMLIAILVEPRLAVVVAVILSIFIGMLVGYQLDYMVIALVGGMAGIFGVARIRKRSDLLRAGLLVALVNVSAMLGFRLLGIIPPQVFNQGIVYGIGSGIISAIVVLGALPVLEPLFKITTNITLLELLDVNQPILNRLKNEAPGTYQSSLVVANLAEGAAQDIGANALLAKVASYYHDVGKINKPSYFTENRVLSQDKHEKLNPTMSSLILISHVKEGVELVRKSKLPEAVIDIVCQHHGTTLASFFYQQALKEGEGEQKINKETFRYPGPRPQTREAAIVMLADSVEAASRTLSDPTPGRIRNLVKRIINDKFVDYQLDESNLALHDLHQITETFTRMLTSMFHTRVEYPEAEAETEKEKHKHGYNRKSAKKNKNKSKNNQASSRENT